MKTAISVPDDVFDRVEKWAADLRMSRSEFYARAVQCYLEELESSQLSRRIDEAIALADEDDSGEAAVAAGRRRLAESSEQ